MLVFSVSAFHTNSQDSTVVFIVVYISSYGGRPVASWWRQICKKSQNIFYFLIYKAGLHYALCGYMKITITLEMKRFFFLPVFIDKHITQYATATITNLHMNANYSSKPFYPLWHVRETGLDHFSHLYLNNCFLSCLFLSYLCDL